MEAIWISNTRQDELGDEAFLDLVQGTLRDPVAPGGYGYGRDPADPRVGRVRYRDVTPRGYPAGMLCIPNDEGSESRGFAFYDWPEDSEDPGVMIATRVKE